MNGNGIAIVGLGLIGGSLLRAFAATGTRVVGYDADPTTRAMARTAAARAPQGTRWQVAGSIADAAAGADLVVAAVPLPAIGAVFAELAAARYTGLVTDVSSVKRPVLDLAGTALRGGGQSLAGFVGGHPMAGRESSGFSAADPGLFTGCAWVLCLEPDTPLHDWLTIATLLTRDLKVRVVPTTAAEHDRAVAAISHVPHLLAAALAAHAAGDDLALTLGAGSFRDGTRVAASRPALVAAMCEGNAEATRTALEAVIADLRNAQAALADRDLQPWLGRAHATRTAWPPEPGPPQSLDADPDALRALGRAGGWITAVAPDRRRVTAVRPA